MSESGADLPKDSVHTQRAQWRRFLERQPAVSTADIEELEAHLADQMAGLEDAGLETDEAFLIAVKRMGNLDELSREFAREHSDRLWKQLVVDPLPGRDGLHQQWELMMVLLLGVAAAIAIKLPAFFDVRMDEAGITFYARNLSFFVLPFLTMYWAWKRDCTMNLMVLVVPFGALLALTNLYPFVPQGQTDLLTVLHLPIVVWLLMGVAYSGGDWRSSDRRMDFVRFTGEFVIYYVLIALGGGVLTIFTLAMFSTIGLDAEVFVGEWIIPCGAMGGVLVAAWLVEAKQGVIENMAPVLTRVFTPMFTLLLLGYLGAMVWTGQGIDAGREVLIGFDLLLVVVLGLVLYSISAREPLALPNRFDQLQWLLIVSALVVDLLALIAIAGRINEFGYTPNRLAGLGMNVVLLVNLMGTAWLYFGFLRGHGTLDPMIRWQTSYIPVYAIWAGFVVVAFPLMFDFL